MTITPATMYWFTRLDVITKFFEVVSILGSLAFLISFGLFIESKIDDTCEPVKKVMSILFKTITSIWMIAIIGWLFTPTSKQMAMIYVVPALTESQVIKQDIPELYDLGINALKDWLKKDTDESGEPNRA